jgi:hypothetical protein
MKSKPTTRSAAPAARVTLPHYTSGIALVITLILVSVTAFLAMAFLILTQREKGSMTVVANQTDARFAADTATERAKAEIAAAVLAYGDPNRFSLQASTNYINPIGYVANPAPGLASPTNVNYDHTTVNNQALTLDQRNQNIANLQYNPRVPVFIRNATNPAAAPEFRFYVDLNRNGRFETNGWWPVISPNGRYYLTNGTETTETMWATRNGLASWSGPSCRIPAATCSWPATPISSCPRARRWT